MNPAISVVMPTHDRSLLLRRVLAGYEAQVGSAPFELIVADDGSADDTPGLLRSYVPRRFQLRPIVLARSEGPGQARNVAMAEATAPLVLIVGDDIMPSPDFVARHLAAHRLHPERCWAVLGRTSWPDDLPLNSLMRHIDGVGSQQFSYTHMRDGQELDYRHFYTSNVSFKRALLDGVAPWFDRDFVHAAYEDAELAYRLNRETGLRIRYDASARAAHYHPYGTEAFAQRQYKCGLMASVFARKHPALRSIWRLERLDRLAGIASRVPLRPFLDSLSADDEASAERVAIGLGTICEALDGPVVDWVYLALFEYFVLKGTLEGELGAGAAPRPRRALLLFGLLQYLDAVFKHPFGRELAETDAASALRDVLAPHEAVRRSWPRLRRYRLLEPVRRLLVPRY